jgi:hypothetical protein
MKRTLFVTALLCAALGAVFAQDAPGASALQDNYFRHPIHSRFYGYYLPLDFVNSFEETKNYLVSKKFIKKYEYIYIRIEKYGIWTQKPILDDGYRENFIQTSNDLKEYQFELRDTNEIIVITKNRERYKKISNDFEYAIPAIDNYLGRIVLHDLIHNGDIILDNNIITIPSLDYEKFIIDTWGVSDGFYGYLDISGFALYLDGFFNRGLFIFMEITGNEYTIFEKVTWNTGQVTKKIIWRKKLDF